MDAKKPLADPMTVAQRWQENQAANSEGKIETSPKSDGEFPSKDQKPLAFRNLSLDTLDKRIMESLSFLYFFAWNLYYDGCSY